MDIVDVFFYVLIVAVVIQLTLQVKIARMIHKEFKFLEKTLSSDIYKIKSQINQHTSTINADSEKRLKANNSSTAGAINKYTADKINSQNQFIAKKLTENKDRKATKK